MTRHQKYPLRELTAEERQELERVSRASSESAARVARAKALLAVSQGHSYTTAAQVSGRRSGDAVSQLVERFNQEGTQRVNPAPWGWGQDAVWERTPAANR